MPTYDFECVSCKKRFELFKKMSDDSVSYCPDCGGVADKIITAGIGISFQGKGFYVNDSVPVKTCTGECSGCEKANGKKN